VKTHPKVDLDATQQRLEKLGLTMLPIASTSS
jgi:hypothetical protein